LSPLISAFNILLHIVHTLVKIRSLFIFHCQYKILTNFSFGHFGTKIT